jgi:histone acetyltransferase MYST1
MATIQVGERRLVRKAVGSWLPAEIIQTRFNEYENHDEYYVHYDGFDRRLDEWVPRYRISEVTDEPLIESKDEADASVSSDQKVLRKSTRKQKKESERLDLNLIQKTDSEMDPTLVALEKEREELTKVKYIDKIQIGIYEVDTWYFSPYPGEYGKEPKLWICEFCLKYMRKEKSYRYHMVCNA